MEATPAQVAYITAELAMQRLARAATEAFTLNPRMATMTMFSTLRVNLDRVGVMTYNDGDVVYDAANDAEGFTLAALDRKDSAV